MRAPSVASALARSARGGASSPAISMVPPMRHDLGCGETDGHARHAAGPRQHRVIGAQAFERHARAERAQQRGRPGAAGDHHSIESARLRAGAERAVA
jgi:hypothetical protein